MSWKLYHKYLQSKVERSIYLFSSNINVSTIPFFSISHIFIIIYCYGSYFDIIGRFEFRLLIIFYNNILCLQFKSSFHWCHSIHFYIFSLHYYCYSSCHSEFVFLPAQWHRFTITIVGFYFLLFFLVSSLPMIVTTCLDCFLHPNYLAEQWYCHLILPLGRLLLDFSSAVVMTLFMVNNLASAPRIYTLSFHLAVIIVFLGSQWPYFTVIIVYCYISKNL